ncbi:ADP-ribosylation factor-like protein 15 [Amphiura filiformis]|uniref:ADP-ribosylation factor-like protein 15 n=1 Tax=Amphiura filiformis TaxID=82378 RepID=UPI003B217DEE
MDIGQCCSVVGAACRICMHKCCKVMCCRKDPPARPQYSLVCLGLTNAGKTTLLQLLCGESTDEIVPTVGFSIKAVPFEDAVLNCKELGGGDNVRPYWDKYYDGTEGVVFVFNSACSEEDLQKLSSLLHSTLSHLALQSRPVLLLASYQDQEGARTVEQLTELMDLERLHASHQQYILQPCSYKDIESARSGFLRLIHLLQDSGTSEDNRI